MENLTEQTNAKIEYLGRGRSNKDVAKSILVEWRKGGPKSRIIRDMLDADEYYGVRNTAIREKSRDYIDANGHRQTNDTLSNAKVPSSFVRSNVQQKVNYAFGKPFMISVNGATAAQPLAPADEVAPDPQQKLYLEEWTAFITQEVRSTIKRIAKDGVNKGIGWAYVTIADGALVIEDVEPQQVYPAWADKAHTKLDALVRDYVLVAYINNRRTEIKKVEFWDEDVVEKYIDDGELKPDPDAPGPAPHMRSDENGVAWGRVPFIALKGNEDEMPMLNTIRADVDAYDALKSKSVDGLLDDIDAVVVLKGISPDMGDLQDARKMMQNSRVVAVDADGDADYLRNTPDISAVSEMLEIHRRDIREFGQSVMSQDEDIRNNPSGVALKFRYQDLDTYVNGLETEFETFMQNLKYFFDRWLEWRGIGSVELWEQYRLTVTLDRDMMINVSADIDDTVKLAATNVSQETIDNWNPAVESHEIENERRAAEAQASKTENDAIFGAEVQKALAERRSVSREAAEMEE